MFRRYGVKRTTMGDIAATAGISRQMLYKLYANKDEVLCATIKDFSDKSLTAIKGEWEKETSLDEKLNILFKHTVVSSYAVVRETPDAADMIDGCTPAGKAEIQRVQAQHKTEIASILIPYATAIESANLSVEQYADFVLMAALGIRDTASSEEHLVLMLKALKMSILSLIVKD